MHSFEFRKCWCRTTAPALLVKNLRSFWRIKHITSALYHPATNGLAERAVQTVKRGLKETQGSMKVQLAKVLMAYRTTPQSTTGMSPSQLLLGRHIRTRLDLLILNIAERVENRQMQQKLIHDRLNPRKTFTKGEKVFARNFRTSMGQKWLLAVIEEMTGPISFMVKLQDDRLVRCHLDHLRSRVDESATQTSHSETMSETDIDNVCFDWSAFIIKHHCNAGNR